MPTNKLLDTYAEHFDDLDYIAEEELVTYQARMWATLTDPDERDEDLWLMVLEDLGFDTEWIDVPLAEWLSTPQDERTLEWSQAGAVLFALASLDASVGPIAKALDLTEEFIERKDRAVKKLTHEQLVAAAKEGVTKKRVKGIREKRTEQIKAMLNGTIDG